jgi:muramoyltetrapeptide carboxypeptidase LdcA involved in peptidoglycan recycling
VVIGELERCEGLEESGGAPLALATIRNALDAARIPHATGAPVGHGRRNEALPFGAAASIDFRRKVVEVLEPAVS